MESGYPAKGGRIIGPQDTWIWCFSPLQSDAQASAEASSLFERKSAEELGDGQTLSTRSL